LDRKTVNPWRWQEPIGFQQGNLITDAGKVLYCSGQTAMDENGVPQHAGDIAAQMAMALDNLATVLERAGMTLTNIVRITTYTTEVPGFRENRAAMLDRLKEADTEFTHTLIGIDRLAFPELMVEIEAVAMA
jgi:enamine deaminase RidA (YjgF/YER057c/UK114 family)